MNSQSPWLETRLSMAVIRPPFTLSRVPMTYWVGPAVTITSEKVRQRCASRKLGEWAIGRAVFHSPYSAATSLMFSRYLTLSANAIRLRSPACWAAR